jgi:hypothetical protein
MSSKKIDLLEIFLLIIILICVTLIILQNFVITGKASEYSTPSNVSISKSLSISFSSNLYEGIIFGTIASLPAVNQNATHNYDGISNGTSLYIDVSSDGNTNVDFCTKADSALTNLAADTIGLGNETYANATSTSISLPALANETPLNLNYTKSGFNISTGGTNYYRFWLDVPIAQPSGDYNNTISFKGVQTGAIC